LQLAFQQIAVPSAMRIYLRRYLIVFILKFILLSFCGRKSGVLRKYGCINQIRHHQNFFTMSQASVKTEDSWPHTHFISVQYSQSHGTEWGK